MFIVPARYHTFVDATLRLLGNMLKYCEIVGWWMDYTGDVLKHLSFAKDVSIAFHMPCSTIAIEGYNISYHEIECFDKYPSY